MRNDRNPCTACFPAGSRTECRVFNDSGGALANYSVVHAKGHFAAMCLQADERFRVCRHAELTAAPSA